MLFGRSPSSSSIENGHECVDLGLSVRWATCNIGAPSPEQRGDYFAWGETRTKSRYDWDTYSMCKASKYVLTEYNTNPNQGRVDNRIMLAPGYDVAKSRWGGRWRMPTPREFSELVKRCKWTPWKGTHAGNPAVVKIEGPNGNCIYLPTTGEQAGNVEAYPMDNGKIGTYWSNSIDPRHPEYAYCISFEISEGRLVCRDYRCFGLNVRAVCL